MHIRFARPGDLPGIRALLHPHAMHIDSAHLNFRDISLVATEDSGRTIGFLWVGLMAKGKVAYIDKFCVAPDYSKHGIGNALATKALEEATRRGVKEVLGFIKVDKHHDKSAMNALKMAMSTDSSKYTFVNAQLDFILSELNQLKEINNGR